MNVNRVFSLFVIALLVLELHAPFAFAVDPVAPSGAPVSTLFKYGDTRDRYDSIFTSCGTEFGVDPNFLKIDGNHESGIRNTGPNSAGAIGIMQIVSVTKRAGGAQVNQLRQGTNRPLVTDQTLLDPQVNICAGAELWAYLGRISNKVIDAAIVKYRGAAHPEYTQALHSEYQRATGNALTSAVFSGAVTPTSTANPLTPLVNGAAPVATGGGICSLSELDAARASSILQQTRDFKAKEINALTGQDMFSNDPKKNLQKETTVNVNLNVVPQVGESAQLAQTMGLLGIEGDKKNIDIIHDLLKRQVAGSDFITYTEARLIANHFGKTENPLNNLFTALKGKTSSVADAPISSAYKVTLPNGVSVPYADFAQAAAINPTACLLDSAYLQGRAYYMGRLDNDVIIALSEAAGSKKANNTFISKITTANLALNGADSLVVPQKYLEYVTQMKTWMAVDFILTAIETAHLFTAVGELKKGKEQLEDIQKIKSNFNPEPFYLNGISTNPEKNIGLQLIANPELNIKDALNTINSKPLASPIYGSIKAEISALKGLTPAEEIVEVKKIIKKNEINIYNGASFSQTEINEVAKYKNRLIYDEQVSTLSSKLSSQKGLTQTELKTLQGKLTKLNGQLGVKLVQGYLWMGPARLALQIADGLLLFSVDGRGPLRDSYMLITVNKNNILADFRSATNWMGSGSLMDAVSDLTDQGVPTNAFNPGKVIVINTPDSPKNQIVLDDSESTTWFSGVESKGWSVSTAWKGQSSTVFFEDIKAGDKNYAHLALQAKNSALSTGHDSKNSVIARGKELSTYFSAIKILFPVLGWSLVDRSGTPLTTILRVFAYDEIFGPYDNIISDVLRPDKFKDSERCSDAVIQQHIAYYKYWTAAQHAVNWVYILKPWIKTIGVVKSALSVAGMGKLAKYAEFVGVNVGPAQLAQGFAASQGFEYVSNCKDDTLNVVTWQNLQAQANGGSLSKTLTSVSSNDFTSKLNLGQALGGVGTKIEESKLSEFVNLKAELKDQSSKSNFDALYYVHLQNVNKKFWNNPNSCMSQCFDDAKGKVICMNKDGMQVCDKEKKKCETIADTKRGPLGWENDALGYAFFPNKIITTSLASCGATDVFTIDYVANLKISNDCAGTQCLRSQLSFLAGREVSNDLSNYLGKTTAIFTDTGRVTFNREGTISFIPFTAGSEVRSPSSDLLATSTSNTQDESFRQAGTVVINGEGKVTLSGYLQNETSIKDQDVGQLRTLFTEKGRIDYNSFNGNIDVFVESLASVNAADIRDFETSGDKCADGSYKVKIDHFIGKSVIGDQASQELNGALKNWMKDCNSEASYFEDSAGNKYELTKDGRLIVTDKDGNKIGEYKVNGVTKDGKDIVFDTDKGPVRMTLGMNENGQPVINVNYPDHDSTGGLLKLLGGVGGALVYNPATGQWELANGLPFGLSPDFTKFGQTIKQDSEGNVRGLPTQNLFALPPETSKRGTANPLAALPSWPEDNAATILLVMGILGVAVAIRTRKGTGE